MSNDPTAPATDDQELANMLAGLNEQQPEATTDPAAVPTPGMQFEPTPVATPATPAPIAPPPVDNPIVPTPAAPVASAPVGSGNPDLDNIKKDALSELRPLVDKLDLPADEKFDTLLLIIRSTDDQSLLKAAHQAAKQIPDDAKRAQALLDVIKEIDFFGGNQQG